MRKYYTCEICEICWTRKLGTIFTFFSSIYALFHRLVAASVCCCMKLGLLALSRKFREMTFPGTPPSNLLKQHLTTAPPRKLSRDVEKRIKFTSSGLMVKSAKIIS